VGTTEEHPIQVSNSPKPAKRRALGQSKKASSRDDEPAPLSRSAQEKIVADLKAPRGILSAHHGGTTLSSTSSEAIQSEPDVDDAMSSPAPSSPRNIPDFTIIRASKLEQELKDLLYDLQHDVVKSIHTCIGGIYNLYSPLDAYPSDLTALLERCWGKNWKSVYNEAIRFNAFKTEYCNAALISAFLYDYILIQQAPVQNQAMAQNFKEWLEASGAPGEECLRHLDLEGIGKFSYQRRFVCFADQFQNVRKSSLLATKRLKEPAQLFRKTRPPISFN